MKIEYVDVSNSAVHRDFITKAVNAYADDFFPPLYTRGSTTDKRLMEGHNTWPSDGLEVYIHGLFKQVNIFAVCDDGVLNGFMSFIHNRKDEPVFSNLGYGINNYISTVCVERIIRNSGIGMALYDFFETKLPKELRSDFASTRTWSRNEYHINLLKKRGYELVHTIKDDRKFNGKIADTVFYIKRLV